MDSGLRPVHVTEKALRYSNNTRAGLKHDEIVFLVQRNKLVHLGATDIDFMLAWDHKKWRPIVLLIARKLREDVVISIWETHFKGIPNGPPTKKQIEEALQLALAPGDPLMD